MNGWKGHRTFPRVCLGSVASIWTLLSGCGGDPTSPTDPAGGGPAVTQPATLQPELRTNPVPPVAVKREAAWLDFDGEIDVLRTRFLPGFEAAATAELERGLARLAAIAVASDRPGAGRVLAEMRAAIPDGAAGAADVEAVRRTIAAMQLALEASPR